METRGRLRTGVGGEEESEETRSITLSVIVDVRRESEGG